MISPRLRLAVALVSALVVLAGCDTAEERAEKHFQNGMALLEQGDAPRALVEFKNVFKLNGKHRDARAAYARTVLAQGKLSEAFRQYLRLVEQYPDDLEGRLMLSEMGILLDNWDAAERHGSVVGELAPDAPRAKVISAALAYRDAVLQDDNPKRREIAQQAAELKSEIPDSIINRSMIIDSLILDGENEQALAELDEVQRIAPKDRKFYQMRLGILARQDDQDAIEQLLRQMIRTFPEDQTVKATLIRFYDARGDVDSAEEFLREQIVAGERDDDARTNLVRFLSDVRGRDVALAEVEAFIDEGTNTDHFRSLRAALRFDGGEEEQAIAELKEVIDQAEDTDQTRDIKITLSRMLDATDNEVGARALVESVLEADESHIDALMMKAAWNIQSDLADKAILLLRTALNNDPGNANILTLMSEAHLRNGDRDLAGETLALAVEASNKAPAESLRYARYLIAEKRFHPAEGVIIDALRLSPQSPELLIELGNIYIKLKDWPRAGQVERALRALEQPETIAMADQMRVAALKSQERDDDAIAFLEALVDQSAGYRAAEIAIVRAHLEREDNEAALAYLARLLEENPDDPSLKFLWAAVNAATGDLEAAEEQYRELLSEDNSSQRIWMELIRILNQTGREDEAEELLESGLNAIPQGSDLLWMRATFLERKRDYEAAIAIYQRLYEQNTSTSVIANNLASLLTTARSDDESLEKAFQISRRLRDSDFPPYQDTYGWIAYRRGDFDEAVRHLAPAARGLPNDALVQYHLAMAYLAVDRKQDALAQFRLAVDVAGQDPRNEFEESRQLIAQLEEETRETGPQTPDVGNLPQPTVSGVVTRENDGN